MPRGDKSKYTDKQKRKAKHIEEGYKERGVSSKVAESRAWATVNAIDHGGKKGGSGKKKAATKSAKKKKTKAKSTSSSTTKAKRSAPKKAAARKRRRTKAS